MSYAKSEDTQRRLVQHTARLLRTRGYAATGLSTIVAESGVPKGSLYHHFPGGKEQLAAASVRYSGSGIVAALHDLLSRTGDPVTAVRAFCDDYIAQLETSAFRKGCPLATIALEAAPEVDAVHEACASSFGEIIDLIARELEAHGVAREAAHQASTLTVAAIEGALLLAKARRDVEPLELIRDRVTGDLERLIKKRRPRSTP